MNTAYAPSLRALHWLMAALVLANIPLGLIGANLAENDPRLDEIFTLHESLGLTVLALVVVRVLVRLSARVPPYQPPLGGLHFFVARATHVLMYAAMIALPVSGYVHTIAGGYGFDWFGLFPVPNLIDKNPGLSKGAGFGHSVWACLLGALLIAHIGAALWHRLIRRDGVFARMWPSARSA